jgi:phosphoserine phosphatase RsbU/P
MDAVRRYDVLDTPPDGAFDRITAIAARLFGVPIAIVSIVDEDRIWFKSHHGLEVGEIGRDPGLCASAIMQEAPWIVEDAPADPRTLANPLVAGEFGLRFYAGAPLRTHDGYRLGTLCVLGFEPREVTADEAAMLEDLAAVVMDELELRLAARLTIKRESELRAHAIELAEALQRSLMPPHLPGIPGVELGAFFRPAYSGQVGGDFYDLFAISDDAGWGVVMGDVSGKGPRAAVVTALVRHTVRAAVLRDQSPQEVLAIVNAAMLSQAPDGDTFCTLVFGRIEQIEDGIALCIGLAGHPPLLVLRADGSVEAHGTPHPPAGAIAEADYGSEAVELRAGDLALLYTDGVIEGRDGMRLFGEARLRELLSTFAGASASAVVEAIGAEVAALEPGSRDDVALLALRAT